MKNICLSIVLTCLAISLSAQVSLTYPKIIGKVDLDKIFAVLVLNNTGVDIQFIYKSQVVDELDNILLDARSGTLTNRPGITTYEQASIPDLNIRWNKLDLRSYSGELTFISELIHPLDTTSVIARVRHTVYLKEGLSVDQKGKPVIDKKRVRVKLSISEDELFVIKDKAFDTIYFNNKNAYEACVDLELGVKQNRKKIYVAKAKICIPPGKSFLTQAQKEKLVVETDRYADRDYNKPITPFISLGDGEFGHGLTPFQHAEMSKEYTAFTNKSIGLSFEYFEHPVKMILPPPDKMVLSYGESGIVQDMEILPGYSDKTRALGMHHPYGLNIFRPDINGIITVSIYEPDDLTTGQWQAFIAFLNNVDIKDIAGFNFEDFILFAPKKLRNVVEQKRMRYNLNMYAFLYKDKDRVFIFQVSEAVDFSKFGTVLTATIDMQRVLNSIRYNNRQLHFTFDEAEILQKVSFKALGPPVASAKRDSIYQKYFEYFCYLNQDHFYYAVHEGEKDEKIIFDDLERKLGNWQDRSNCKPLSIKKLIPGEPDFREFKTFSWDSMQISFDYWVPDSKNFTEPFTRVREYDYVYDTSFMIVHYQFARGDGPDPRFLDKGKQFFRMKTNILSVKPTQHSDITVSKILTEGIDLPLLEAYIKKENPGNKEVVVKTIGGLKIIAPTRLVNQDPFYGMATSAILIQTKGDSYIFKINGGLNSDIPHFLNSITLGGKKLFFNTRDGYKLDSIQLR